MHFSSRLANFALRRCIQIVATTVWVAVAMAAPKPAAENARLAASVGTDVGHMIVDVQNVPPPAPLFYSTSVEQTVRIGAIEVIGEARIKSTVIQGKPEVLSVGMTGDGEVIEVVGRGLRDWSVRQVPEAVAANDKSAPAPGTRRLLDLRPTLGAGTADLKSLEVTVRTRIRKPSIPGSLMPVLFGPGDAVGFASKITVQADDVVDVQLVSAAGLVGVADEVNRRSTWQFIAAGEARLSLKASLRGAGVSEIELLNAQLSGKAGEAGTSMEFHLRGQLHAIKAGARLRLLAGRAALSDKALGDGWHVELVSPSAKEFAYELVADREGTFALDLPFAAEVRESGDWRSLDFKMPAGVVVPLQLEGLGEGVSFKSDAPIVPVALGQSWRGFLPADGAADIAWKRTRATAEAALFFTSYEQADVRIGAGLMRESSRVSLRVLQGKLNGLRLRLEGAGEVLGVEGVAPFSAILGWKVIPDGGSRVLEVKFSRPMETEGTLVVHSQSELGAYPITAEPMRLIPEGVVRHSGFLRVANDGAVRLEVTDATGMMQLAPSQFPGAADERGVRQVFVYRFPSATYSYRVAANQIQPEVGVSQIVTYELGETDRVINASLELDVREAPLRDWSLQIPDDYTVAGITGNDVADYVAESTAAAGYRTLKVLFSKAVEGRELLQLRLENNQGASAGEWSLRALRFPGAKNVRGNVGVVSVAGYRVVPAGIDRLVETPLTYFPRQTPGLQQAWRQREPDWSATMRIEALGQSVQADVFHLYSIKEGIVYGSVLINYFVVGAPANEWRVEVPQSVGNIDVVGQNVRKDWRREGDQVIISLHQPVLGAATLLITFEQPMSARGGTINPGQVRPLNVQGERGFIQIVSPLQVKHDTRVTEGGLLKLEPLELPAEYRLLSSSPALAAYQYTARPFKLEVGVEWYAPGDMVDQVVDFAKLSSQISRDGQIVTEARYFVKTRGLNALRLILPAGVKLWETRVDNELTTARIDGETTLIPLPARLNPNDPVAVFLRYGQSTGGSGSQVKLLAPRTQAATVINEWVVRGDSERLLVPRASNAALARPALTETGFEWLSQRGRMAVTALLASLALGVILLRSRSSVMTVSGLLFLVVSVAGALLFAHEAWENHRPNLRELTFAVTVVPAGQDVAVTLDNVGEIRAMVVSWGMAAILLGLAVLTLSFARIQKARQQAAASGGTPVAVGIDRILPGLAVIAMSAGILAQRGGAALFFVVLAVLTIVLLLIPGMIRWNRERHTGPVPPPDTSDGGASSVVPALALFAAIGLVLSGRPAKADGITDRVSTPWAQEGARPAQSLIQSWTVRDDRIFGEMDVTVRGSVGDSFLLLRPPALLTDFKSEGLRVTKVERDGQTSYFAVPEREGVLTAHVRFEMALGDRTQPITLPTGAAAAQRVTVVLDQAGWEFTSPSAVQILPVAGVGDNRSGATLVLAPRDVSTIRLQPMRRNVAAESTQFFAEVSNLYVPGPGVVNGTARVTIRPVQGRVTDLELEVPKGLTVGDVSRGPVGSWRFDPGKRRLRVSVEPAQTGAFTFDVETQLGTGALPFDLALQPLRVVGSTGEVGTLGLAFGGDAQSESVRATELSTVNLQDFDGSLLPRGRDGQPLATLQQVWRYGQTGGKVELKIAPVSPEVRVTGRQVLSLDDDRLVMAVDLNVAITRVGLFKLSFALPEGLEVDALSGAALSHWTEAVEGKQRVITMHLNGRTLGDQAFALTLAGAAPRAQDAWVVPHVSIREATRQSGEALIVPGKGLRVRAVQRERVTQLDPRSVGGLQPGTLAFRLLQDDWVLHLGIETLEAWVTVQSLQEITVREGQTLTRFGLRYRVENAAVKQVRLRLPGIGEERARTVRATGTAVADMVKVPGEADVWEIRFQHGIAGETDVQVEFQGPATRDQDRELVTPAVFIGARQSVQFVAIRAGGRLEMEAGTLPRGWTRIDWSAVPVALQDRSERSVPGLCYRVAEPEGALAVIVKRHEVAEALKLRVTRGELMTLFAPSGESLTAVELKIDVLEKSTLRVRLPEKAKLFNTFVNAESVLVVREGDAYLFHVAPNSDAGRSAIVRLVYSAPNTAARDVELVGPSLSVPLENVAWRVVIPTGYEMTKYHGAMRLREDRYAVPFTIEQYRALVETRRSEDAKKAVALLQEASSLLQKGDQQKASEVLSRASNAKGLDEASNEDARVQLRNLKTQQTVLGLNTRRQRLYLDNRVDAAPNEQLEQAANLNPLMQGQVNFDPQQLDQLLMGNTLEENTALRGIATRLVDQQLTAEPAPGAIDVTLPDRGHLVTFTRTLQVDGSAPLALSLTVKKAASTSWPFTAMVLGGLGFIAVLPFTRRWDLAN